MVEDRTKRRKPVRFERGYFEAGEPFLQIGSGDIGGKAAGLLEAFEVIEHYGDADSTGRVRIEVPASVVVATGVFEEFMERNDLYDIAMSGVRDDRIAHAFQAAEFPEFYVGDLMTLIMSSAGNPLAVRSSSRLEDALAHPFAGVYETKMIPNNQASPSARFRSLVEAIKFVYASTFFRAAAGYMAAIQKNPREERMAVLIQKVVGRRFGDRFYPEVSGVGRSFNYYRTGSAKPEEGVISLALGLGKTIVDGGVSWSYSPAHPKARSAFSSLNEMLHNTQLSFWAVNLGKPPEYDPINETEYLITGGLKEAEYDGTLRYVASTYDNERERLMAGISSVGPRVIDFGPLLQLSEWPVNALIAELMERFKTELGHAVECEFAVSFNKRNGQTARLVVLQVRPMLVTQEFIELTNGNGNSTEMLVYSEKVMGNGIVEGLRDIVYVKPGVFDRAITPQIADELEIFNRQIRDENKRYLLIGFGRWGSSERWLGIPVTWGQISAAAVIVESSLPEMNVDPSQGSHFFHNIESFHISYFSVHHELDPPIDWEWLATQKLMGESETICHVEASQPLTVKVDGRTGRGVIWRH